MLLGLDSCPDFVPGTAEVGFAGASGLALSQKSAYFFTLSALRSESLEAAFGGCDPLPPIVFWTVTFFDATADVGCHFFRLDCELVAALSDGLLWNGRTPFGFTELGLFVTLMVFRTTLHLLVDKDLAAGLVAEGRSFLSGKELFSPSLLGAFRKEFILDWITLPRYVPSTGFFGRQVLEFSFSAINCFSFMLFVCKKDLLSDMC